MEKYNHRKIEARWQEKWIKTGQYKTSEDPKKPKYYILDMFPYPSGAGLHVGHPKGFIATDIFARMKTMQGYNVLHPMGWDAFGLPAENYAIKNKTHPKVSTDNNIATFKSQLAKLGFSYDWEREINTTDPKFYKWTQWIFLQMFKRGLAYESHEPINWCPSCQTGLANEDLEDGKCERCGSEIEQKPMRQWVLKITEYADRLLNDLEKLPKWEESIKEMQKNWIGRSEGAIVEFKIKSKKGKAEGIEVFTTRPDTLFGATYFVMSPEHPIIKKYELQITNYKEVKEYINKAKKKTEMERTDLAKEKTGVELKGIKAINPVNNEEIPIWIADYVLINYGTGAIMAVPAHDERDYEFARKYDLPIKQVVAPFFQAEQDSPDALKKDKPVVERNVVYGLLRNPRNDKILMLEWPEYKTSTFVVGGLKNGEDPVAGAEREIIEETGYKNIKFIRQLGGEVHVKYFAIHKDENRYARVKCFYFELEDDKNSGISEAEKNKHKVVWVDKEKVSQKIKYNNFKIFWDILNEGEKAESEAGIAINSDILNGLSTLEAKKKIIRWLNKKKLGKKAINYKLRDWVFSRQRYWGEPIPIVHCPKCGAVAVPEKDLPLELPQVEHYEPSGTGESPLVLMTEWVNTTCPKCKGPAKRETNTMPQWAGSSWYYLRYIDPDNDKALIDKKKDKYWSPVDFYVGGAEHATRHLIYARFWHKFLFDIGVINYDEPFTRLQHVGLIAAEDGRKMSKRWGNVINPDEIVEKFGADSMRVYEMFMGPFSQASAWSTNGLIGARKFLEKIWKISEYVQTNTDKNESLNRLLHKTIKKVGDDIMEFKFNTAVSSMMIFINKVEKEKIISAANYRDFLIILSPFAPHIAEELWQKLGNKKSIFKQMWPKYNRKLIKDKTIQLVVQINGKLRDTIEADAEIDKDEAIALAKKSERIQKWLADKKIKKEIFVKGKLINLVIG